MTDSARKIARLAAQGRGRRVRVGQGRLFPTVLLSVIVVGIALIAYARQSQPNPTALDTASTDYVLAVGVYACDGFVDGLPTAPPDLATVAPGATIVAPGVVRWTPQVLAGERRAKLQTVLDLLGIAVDDDSITLPASMGGASYVEGEDDCGGEEATVQVTSWADATVEVTSKVSIADLGDVRLTGDGMAFTIAFVPRDTEAPLPPAAADLATALTDAQG
ncbi:MAG: hypothetical protein ACO26C_04855 [Ilumatobacteraceae bacterium]